MTTESLKNKRNDLTKRLRSVIESRLLFYNLHHDIDLLNRLITSLSRIESEINLMKTK